MRFGLIVLTVTIALSNSAGATTLELVPLASTKIAKGDFDEPSGLALDSERGFFWSVSDDTPRIAAIDLFGRVIEDRSFDLDDDLDDLEGIAMHPDGHRLLIAKEDKKEILEVAISTGQILARHRLSDMACGTPHCSDLLYGSGDDSLEGLTVNPRTGTIYAIKEARPRLLVEISPDLARITDIQELTAEAGFVSQQEDDDNLDVSAIAFDIVRQCIWIVSDEASRIFLYDLSDSKAIAGDLLRPNGKPLKNPEGIAFGVSADMLYVVTDDRKESRFAVYRIRHAAC